MSLVGFRWFLRILGHILFREGSYELNHGFGLKVFLLSYLSLDCAEDFYQCFLANVTHAFGG